MTTLGTTFAAIAVVCVTESALLTVTVDGPEAVEVVSGAKSVAPA